MPCLVIVGVQLVWHLKNPISATRGGAVGQCGSAVPHGPCGAVRSVRVFRVPKDESAVLIT